MEDRGSVNAFANDGSFMEIFRKKMEEERLRSSSTSKIEGRSSSGGGAKPGQLTGESCSLPDRSAGPAGSIRKEMLPESATSQHESATQRSNDADVHELSVLTETASSQQCTTPTTEKSKSRPNNESETEDSVTSDAVAARKFPQEQSPGGTLKTASSATSSVSAQKKYSLLSHVGKRRDGKMSLKTGAVKKQRIANTQETHGQDSWSKYMAEVQKYKAHVCGDEDKSRPLVK